MNANVENVLPQIESLSREDQLTLRNYLDDILGLSDDVLEKLPDKDLDALDVYACANGLLELHNEIDLIISERIADKADAGKMTTIPFEELMASMRSKYP